MYRSRVWEKLISDFYTERPKREGFLDVASGRFTNVQASPASWDFPEHLHTTPQVKSFERCLEKL